MANIPFTRQRASAYADAMIAMFLGLGGDTAGIVTDLNVGSNLRTIFEALALRFENQDNRVYAGLRDAIPQAVYDVFGFGEDGETGVGFPKLPATTAVGNVRFQRTVAGTGDITIPIGTVFRVAGTVPEKQYTTRAELLIPDGTSQAEVRARAIVAGPSGNTPAGTMTLATPVTGIAAATNPAAFINGTAEETDEARRARFAKFIRNLARSQHAGLEVGASFGQVLALSGEVIEAVAFSRALDVPDKRGLVDIWIDNGGGSASLDLLADVQTIIDGTRLPSGERVRGYKAAGVVVTARSVTPVVQGVTAALTIAQGYDPAAVIADATERVTDSIAQLDPLENLPVARLTAALMGTPGVVNAPVSVPATDVLAGDGQRIVPGVVMLSAAVEVG